jgi:hypothetical protein
MAIPEATVHSMGELIQALRSLRPDFGKTEYWFRGHTRQREWPLIASVHRYFDSIGERQLALRFQVGAVGRSKSCPDENDFGSWLVLMQHHGLPTRLLDWTRSLVVATYFAVAHEPAEEDAVLWLLAPEHLNRLGPTSIDGICLLNGESAPPAIRSLTAAAFGDSKCDSGPYAVLSQDLDMRVLVQSGAFTIHGTPAPLDEHPGASEFLARLKIPVGSRQTFQEELFAMGARRSLLFPDLHNLARELASSLGQNVRLMDRQL